MPFSDENNQKRAVAFFDGQNLFRHAKDAFGYYHPNYDPKKLFKALCEQENWKESGIRFYTGVPTLKEGDSKRQMWHGYWSNRLLAMRRAGIFVESRPLRYRKTEILASDGSVDRIIETPQEKGIDVRLALDVVRMSVSCQFDVAVVFSQDQDLAEVANDLKEIARNQRREIQMVSAYPSGPRATTTRGIQGARWIKIEKELYDRCLDLRDYRPKEQ